MFEAGYYDLLEFAIFLAITQGSEQRNVIHSHIAAYRG
jgi:hypothetical protein